MFKNACEKIREGLYGVMGSSMRDIGGGKAEVNVTNGTAFMVAPGYLITAGHFIHQDNDPTKPVHQKFEAIRAPEVGKLATENAVLVAKHPTQDIALLKLENPRDNSSLKIKEELLSRGENCGFLGFPLAVVVFNPQNGARNFNLNERFQGAYISNYINLPQAQGFNHYYEIDTLMYGGSSGCPGFTPEGEIVGIQVASIMQQNKGTSSPERVAISIVIPSKEIMSFLKEQKVF